MRRLILAVLAVVTLASPATAATFDTSCMRAIVTGERREAMIRDFRAQGLDMRPKFEEADGAQFLRCGVTQENAKDAGLYFAMWWLVDVTTEILIRDHGKNRQQIEDAWHATPDRDRSDVGALAATAADKREPTTAEEELAQRVGLDFAARLGLPETLEEVAVSYVLARAYIDRYAI